MPVREFNEQFLASALMGTSALMEMNIILGLDETGCFLKLVRRADNVPFFEFCFNDDMVLRWAEDLKTIRKQQHEAAKLAREEAEREGAASRCLYFVRADGRCECPNCGATGMAAEVRQYGRVVCLCGLDSAEGDD